MLKLKRVPAVKRNTHERIRLKFNGKILRGVKRLRALGILVNFGGLEIDRFLAHFVLRRD